VALVARLRDCEMSEVRVRVPVSGIVRMTGGCGTCAEHGAG
jgi:hypothetical protein